MSPGITYERKERTNERSNEPRGEGLKKKMQHTEKSRVKAKIHIEREKNPDPAEVSHRGVKTCEAASGPKATGP